MAFDSSSHSQEVLDGDPFIHFTQSRKESDKEFEQHAFRMSIDHILRKALVYWHQQVSLSTKKKEKASKCREKCCERKRLQCLKSSLMIWLLYVKNKEAMRVDFDITFFRGEIHYFKRWRYSVRQALQLRLAESTLLTKRWGKIVASSFGAWYISFVYEFRLRRAASKLHGNIRRRILWRSLFYWRFIFERSLYLRQGRRDELDTHSASLSLEKVISSTGASRRVAFRYYADQVRMRVLGKKLLFLRNKICMIRFGAIFFRAFRRRDAEILVAVTIQRLWRAYSVRALHYVPRIVYFKRFCGTYLPRLRRFLRRKRYRLVFDILLKFVKNARKRRDASMSDYLQLQVIETMKYRLIVQKLMAVRRNSIAGMHYDNLQRCVFWTRLKGTCAMSMTEKAARFFHQGSVSAHVLKRLSWHSSSCVRARLAATRHDIVAEVRALHRLRRWTKCETFRRFVTRTSLLFWRRRLLMLSMRIMVRILKRTLPPQHRGSVRARANHSLMVKKRCLHQIRQWKKMQAARRTISRDCFLHRAGRRCFCELLAYTVFRHGEERVRGVSERHARTHAKKASLSAIIAYTLTKQSWRQFYDRRSNEHILTLRRSIGLATLRNFAHTARLRRSLNSQSGASHEFKEAVERQREDGLRVRKLFIGVLPPSKQGMKFGGMRQQRFDRSQHDAHFISQEFWAHDDPRRRVFLRVITSRKDVLTSRVFRRLMSYGCGHSARQRALRASTRYARDRTLRLSLKCLYVCTLKRMRHTQRTRRLVHEMTEKKHLFFLMALRRHKRVRKARRTFYAVGRLRKAMRHAVLRLHNNAFIERKRKESILLMRRRRPLVRSLRFLSILAPYKRLAAQSIDVGQRRREMYLRTLFFDHMKWILFHRVKLRRTVRRFTLRRFVEEWLILTAREIGMSSLRSRRQSRIKTFVFSVWRKSCERSVFESLLVGAVKSRSCLIGKKFALMAWMEAINMKRLASIVSEVKLKRDMARKRGVMLHWNHRCMRREADLWKHCRDIFYSLRVFAAWQKHQAHCVQRAKIRGDHFGSIKCFRHLLYRQKLHQRRLLRETYAMRVLCHHHTKLTMFKWRKRTSGRVSAKKTAMGRLQQLALGIGLYRSGYGGGLVVATSGSARRLGLLLVNEFESTLGGYVNHVSHREALKTALNVRLESKRCSSALRLLALFAKQRCNKRRLIELQQLFQIWKNFMEKKKLRRLSFLLRLRHVLDYSKMTYVLLGLKLNVTIRNLESNVSWTLRKSSFVLWVKRFKKRSLLRKGIGLLVRGSSYQTLRLYWRLWKASAGPALRSERLFLRSIVFRRWRGCFVAARHFKIKLLGDVIEEWSGLVFGRLRARFQARRGRRIAARLMTRYSQRRCGHMRVYFNRWATNADVILPAQRLEAGLAKGRCKLHQKSSLVQDQPRTNLSFSELEVRGVETKEALETWQSRIETIRKSTRNCGRSLHGKRGEATRMKSSTGWIATSTEVPETSTPDDRDELTIGDLA